MCVSFLNHFPCLCVCTYTLTAAAATKLLQSCPTLCDPIDGSPLGSSVPGILQARILEWVAISFSNAWEWKVKVKSLSRAWLLATPSPPGSSVHGIFQARVLEWGAIAFSLTSHSQFFPYVNVTVPYVLFYNIIFHFIYLTSSFKISTERFCPF